MTRRPSLAVALALLLAGCGADRPEPVIAPPDRLGQAQSFLDSGLAAEAERLYGPLAKDPATRPVALRGQGLAALLRQDWSQAESLLRQSLALEAGQWQAWNGLGQVYDAGRRWSEAAEAYGKALALKPDSAAATNNLGYSLLLQGKPAEALPWLTKASRIDPHQPAAAANLRLALAALGRYDDAVAEVAPEDRPAALNNAAVMAMTRGDTAMARKMLTEALQGSPGYYERARRNLERLGP